MIPLVICVTLGSVDFGVESSLQPGEALQLSAELVGRWPAVHDLAVLAGLQVALGEAVPAAQIGLAYGIELGALALTAEALALLRRHGATTAQLELAVVKDSGAVAWFVELCAEGPEPSFRVAPGAALELAGGHSLVGKLAYPPAFTLAYGVAFDN